MDGPCAYGRWVTIQRLDALLAEVDGVRSGEDIECVHRMRVASRRLRSVLRLFGECFKGKRGKRWRKAVRKVTATLGEARDLDVQLELLEALSGNGRRRSTLSLSSRPSAGAGTRSSLGSRH